MLSLWLGAMSHAWAGMSKNRDERCALVVSIRVLIERRGIPRLTGGPPVPHILATHSCSQQFSDNPALVGDRDRAAFGRHDFFGRVDTETAVERGGQVFGAGGAFVGFLGPFVAAADD